MLKARSRQLARGLLQRVRRIRGYMGLRIGRFAAAAPLSTAYGFDRGTPIDRFYIENFLQRHSADIHGTLLEMADSRYSRRFGGDRVDVQQVVDLSAGNEQATIIGDLCDPAVLPGEAFDCIIVTQTLQFIYDMPKVVQQVHRALLPGGVALITVPGIAPARGGSDYQCYWSLTEDALSRLVGDVFGAAGVTVSTQGNLFAATAFLHGAALEETPIHKLRACDPAYPVIVAARAVKSPDAATPASKGR